MIKVVFLLLLGGLFSVGLLPSQTNEVKEIKQALDWSFASSIAEIDQAWESDTPVLFFKHSNRCGLSMMVLEDLERDWDVSSETCKLVFIDIFKYREVSNYLSEKTGIRHHSPQAFLIKKGKLIYTQTHSKIRAKNIKQALSE